jgi:hypothetical protein
MVQSMIDFKIKIILKTFLNNFRMCRARHRPHGYGYGHGHDDDHPPPPPPPLPPPTTTTTGYILLYKKTCLLFREMC